MIEAMGEAIDAVIIASHTKDHARHALPFVQVGIPIYLEKPLTDGLEEAFDFVEKIGRSNSLLQVGLQRRYDPALLYTKKLLSEGLIGEVREIRCILRDQFPTRDLQQSRIGPLTWDSCRRRGDFFLDDSPTRVGNRSQHNRLRQSN